MYAGLVCCGEKKSVGWRPNSAGVRRVRVVASVTLGALGLTTSLPHCLQNFAPAIRVVPQFAQVAFDIFSVNITTLAFDYASIPSAARLPCARLTGKTKMINRAGFTFILLFASAFLFFHLAAINTNGQAQRDTTSWVTVSPADDGFTALMPQAPVEKIQKKKHDKLSVEVRQYTATTPQKTVYTIWSLKNPSVSGSALSAGEIDDFLDLCADLVWDVVLEPRLKSFPPPSKGRYGMNYRRDMQSVISYPGREYFLWLGSRRGLAYIYYGGPQAFVVMAFDVHTDDVEGVNKFVSSFTLKTPPVFSPKEDLPVATAGPQPPSTRPHSPREVTQKARILTRPEPQYTEAARNFQVSGTVVLRAVFSSNGQVTNIRVLNRLPHGLTKRAVEAAREIKFAPAIKDGQPVSQYIQIEYNFNLY
jgi:TonB family protein